VRVVHVVRQFHPGVGGIEAFVLALAKQQRLENIDAAVVTLNRLFTCTKDRLPSHDIVEGVPVVRIGYWGSTRYPVASRILSCITPFDIVHVHGVDFFCDFLALTQSIHRKPLVLSTHGGFFHTSFGGILKHLFFNTITRLSLRRYARVFACSVNDEALFGKITTRRLMRIDNGVDHSKFFNCGRRTFAPHLVYFGRLASNKGLERLIDAFSGLRAKMPDACLHIMGRDWDRLLAPLQQRIDAAGHTSKIVIHVDPTDADIRRIIAQCSFFVSASRYEGFGMALVEAMGAGLLPIVSRIPSFAAILERSQVGLLIDFDDGACGSTLASFIENSRGSIPEMRNRAIAHSQRFSWQEVAPRFLREYQRVLGWGEREILGVNIQSLTCERAVDRIDHALAAGRTLGVTFANAHSLNVSSWNRRFHEVLKDFLVLNDGLGVDIASRAKFGQPFAANLNGTDFVPAYLALTRHPLRIYLVGSTDEVAARAARTFAQRYPQHNVVGARNGFFIDHDDIEQACRAIRAVKADCILVGMGNPLQELWISEHGTATGAKLLIGVGALLDFTAGRVQRAPLWVRNLRCEWIYRLVQEPRRLARRYLIDNITFLYRVLRDTA
jgi:alpha-1,3-mannosyltransferase